MTYDIEIIEIDGSDRWRVSDENGLDAAESEPGEQPVDFDDARRESQASIVELERDELAMSEPDPDRDFDRYR